MSLILVTSRRIGVIVVGGYGFVRSYAVLYIGFILFVFGGEVVGYNGV